MLRPYMESKYKGIQIYLACKDDSYYLLQDEPRCVKKSEYKKDDFCYVRNIMTNLNIHPILEILQESDIEIPTLSCINENVSNKIYLYTDGFIPTKSLDQDQIKKIITKIESYGKKCIVNEKHDGISSIFSVENEFLVSSAINGLNCTLIDNGYSMNLYRKLFAKINVISMNW